MEQQRADALVKQLEQLERFIQEFLSQERQGALGHVRSSKDLPIQSPRCTTFQPSGLPSHIERELELHQLQRIKKKLQLTASEIAGLIKTDYGLESASASPPVEPAEAPQEHSPGPAATDSTPIRSSRTADAAHTDDPAADTAVPTSNLAHANDQQDPQAHALLPPQPPESLQPAAPGSSSQGSSPLQPSTSAPLAQETHAPSGTLHSSSSSRGTSRLPRPPSAAPTASAAPSTEVSDEVRNAWPRGLLRAPSSPAATSALHAREGASTSHTAGFDATPPQQHVHKVVVASRQGSGDTAAAAAAQHGNDGTGVADDNGTTSTRAGAADTHGEGGHSLRRSAPSVCVTPPSVAVHGASGGSRNSYAANYRGPSRPPTSVSAGRLGSAEGKLVSPRESEHGSEVDDGKEGSAGGTSTQEVERLQARVAHLRPSANSAARLKKTVAALEAQAAEAKSLQARAADLSQLTEKLPALRKQLTQNQAAAANVRALEKQLAAEQKAHPGEGELLTRLQAQEQELAARAASVSEIKERMQQLSMVALEVEQMESRVAVLAPIAGRLPVLQSQHEALLESCKEVATLEAQQAEMRETVAQRRRLQMQINVLQPQAEGVEALRAQLAQLQQEAAEAAQLKQALQEQSPSVEAPPGDSPGGQPGKSQTHLTAAQGDLGVTPSRVRASRGLLSHDMGSMGAHNLGAASGSMTRRGAAQEQREQQQQQQQEQEQPHVHVQPPFDRSSTLQGLNAAAESLAALPSRAPSPHPSLSARPSSSSAAAAAAQPTLSAHPSSSSAAAAAAAQQMSQPQLSPPWYTPPTHRRPSASSVISSWAETPPQEFMTPCRSFSRSSSCTSLSSADPEVIGQCLPLPPQWQQRGRSQSLFGDALWSPPVSSSSLRQMRTPPRPPARAQQQPVSLTINVCEPPPLSLHLRVEQPLVGIPDEVLMRLQHAGTAAQQTSAALEEIQYLDTHREGLEARIESLRQSPQALEVLRLQQRLLELQQQEVAQLEGQVASLAGVGDRLSALRAERARLESLADEVFEAEAQLEETRAVRELQAQTRAAKTEAEATEAEIAALEQSAVHLEEACGRRDTIMQHLAQLRAGAAEVESLEKEIAALAGAEVVIAKLHSRRSELEAKARSIPELEAQCDACAQEIERLSAKASKLPALQEEAAVLSQQVAALPILEQEVESLRTQLKAVESLSEEQHTLSQRVGSSTAASAGELAARKAELEGLLANKDLATAATDVRRMEAQLHELRQQAERREALQALCENMATVPQQVSNLQARVETLKLAVAERQRLHQQTLELEEQLVSVAGPAGGLEGARVKHQQMLEAVEQARMLKAKVAMLAPEALQLGSLREQHAALQRDTAEASLLKRDATVLRLRASVLRQLHAMAEAAAASVAEGQQGEQGIGKQEGGGYAQGDNKTAQEGRGYVQEGRGNVQEGSGNGENEEAKDGGAHTGGLEEASPKEVGSLLEQVFQRMRAAEAEQLGQQAEIDDLNERVKELSTALDVSNKSVRKLKSLARAVGRIRSGFMPEQGYEEGDEEDELDSSSNLTGEEPESPMRTNPVYRA